MPQGKRIVLASRPVGEPKPSDFRIEEYPVPPPGDGQVLLRTIWLSLDPYMRGRMSDAASYAAPVQVGAGYGRWYGVRSGCLQRCRIQEG